MSVGIPGRDDGKWIVGSQGLVDLFLTVGGPIKGLKAGNRRGHLRTLDALVPDGQNAAGPVGQSEQRIGVINAGINDADHDTAPGSTQGGLIKYRSYAAAFQGSRVLEPKMCIRDSVNMICNINLDTGEIKLVSVYRDSYLSLSENGPLNKINQAYFLGGAEQAVEALNRNLDLKINDFVTFNWKGVAQAIDILGGVDVELSKAEFYYINSFITETVKATGIGSHQLTHAGMNHLDGVQAVAYGRLRLMDTDYARTERQRKIIALAFEKAQKADFQTLYTLIGTVFPNVYTSLWVDDLVNNARNINKFYLGETTGFPNQRGDANMGKKGAVVVPATLESNVIRLHEFLFGDSEYVPSETVKSLSAKISSDTGVYKEGQVIDKVGTSGGVIQPPKTKAAETEATKKSNDDEGYQYIYETDADGKKDVYKRQTYKNLEFVVVENNSTEKETCLLYTSRCV